MNAGTYIGIAVLALAGAVALTGQTIADYRAERKEGKR